jgi:hypothetical protein
VSTILKALQRLEDEKSANVERSLEEQIVERRPPPRPERRGLKIGAVAIGGLAIAGAAFFFWQTQEKSSVEVAMEPPPPTIQPEPAKKAAAEKPRRKRPARQALAARVEEESSAIEISPVIEVVKHLDAQPADSAESAASSKSAASSEDGKSEDVAAAPPKAKPGAARPAGRRSASKPKPSVARTAEQAKPAEEQVADAKPPATQVSGGSVRSLATPSQPAPVEIAAVAPKSVPAAEPAPIPAAVKEPTKKTVARAKLPVLSIEKTIWHPDANRRVALVKLLEVDEVIRMKEGDAVGPLVVIDINPGSVLFTHDDVEIRYNVGGG